MGLSFLLSLCAFAHVLRSSGQGETAREVFNFPWFQMGGEWLKLGWVLDPLTAVMLVMVTFVGLLIFIYSAATWPTTKISRASSAFLSLFAAAMLGVVIANSLLLLFMCWEMVGLTSYLLIGFWYQKPARLRRPRRRSSRRALATWRFLLGMVWLYSQAGTLLFYDHGAGCLEHSALARLVAQTTSIGMAASTGIALLIFCGAVGKSGQVPLHVWLPDAMEGPTPVSALIHAATMVAAGVFLVARVYPLMAAHGGIDLPLASTTALEVVTWIGAITAVFAALIAVAQDDIKRILAYSTVSQLGLHDDGSGRGRSGGGDVSSDHACFLQGAAVSGRGIGHSRLPRGAGHPSHGRAEEIHADYVCDLCGGHAGAVRVSAVLLGFLEQGRDSARCAGVEHFTVPFYLGAFGALLTAFYMTRQVYYVFFGESRLAGAIGRMHAATYRASGAWHVRLLRTKVPPS